MPEDIREAMERQKIFSAMELEISGFDGRGGGGERGERGYKTNYSLEQKIGIVLKGVPLKQCYD